MPNYVTFLKLVKGKNAVLECGSRESKIKMTMGEVDLSKSFWYQSNLYYCLEFVSKIFN